MQRDELLYRTRCRCYNPQPIESLPGLVHHSDRGSQYASSHYTDLLKENGIDISMSRKANPWDNAACESFMKTLKYEEVVCCERLVCKDQTVLYRRWRMT